MFSQWFKMTHLGWHKYKHDDPPTHLHTRWHKHLHISLYTLKLILTNIRSYTQTQLHTHILTINQLSTQWFLQSNTNTHYETYIYNYTESHTLTRISTQHTHNATHRYIQWNIHKKNFMLIKQQSADVIIKHQKYCISTKLLVKMQW